MNDTTDPTAALEQAREALTDAATHEQNYIYAARKKAAAALGDLRKELIHISQGDTFHPVVFARDNSATLVGLTAYLDVIDNSAEFKAARSAIAPREAEIAALEEEEIKARAEIAAAKQAHDEAVAAAEAEARAAALAHPAVTKAKSVMSALFARAPKTAQKLGLS